MNLLFELYAVSYPMMGWGIPAMCQAQGDPSTGGSSVHSRGNHGLVHSRGRVLCAIPGCPLQGMRGWST